MKNNQEEILDPKILKLFVEHLSTVLECEENTDPDKVQKLDAIRNSRHNKLCDAFKVPIQSKEHVTLYRFGKERLDKFFDGDIEKAARYAYYCTLDYTNNERSNGRRGNTCYHNFPWMKEYVENATKYAEDAIAEFEAEFESRRKWYYDNVEDKKFSDGKSIDEFLTENKLGIYKIFDEHDFCGHKYTLRCKIEKMKWFADHAIARDCTEANYNENILDRKDIDKYLAPIALQNWQQTINFKKAKKLIEEREN